VLNGFGQFDGGQQTSRLRTVIQANIPRNAALSR